MAARKSRSRTRRVVTRRRVTRSPRRNAKGGNVWSRQDIAFMRKYYRNNETSWVARQLGRTVYSVRYKASDLSIKKSPPSIWRGNHGVTTAKKTRTSSTRRKSWSAKSPRRTQTRRATSRRTTKRRTKKSRW